MLEEVMVLSTVKALQRAQYNWTLIFRSSARMRPQTEILNVPVTEVIMYDFWNWFVDKESDNFQANMIVQVNTWCLSSHLHREVGGKIVPVTFFMLNYL